MFDKVDNDFDHYSEDRARRKMTFENSERGEPSLVASPRSAEIFMVVGGGLEPSARGFSVRCSTN